jgi:hypothetical protein
LELIFDSQYYAKFLILLVLLSLQLNDQRYTYVTPSVGEILPEWATLMYSEDPNVWQVDDLYRIWRQAYPEEKTTYTQYYKKWRRANEPFVNREGFIQKPTEGEEMEFSLRLEKFRSFGSTRDARGSEGRREVSPPTRKKLARWAGSQGPDDAMPDRQARLVGQKDAARSAHPRGRVGDGQY